MSIQFFTLKVPALRAFSGPVWCAASAILYCTLVVCSLEGQEIPTLTDEELGTAQQQALLMALAGDPYGHRGSDHCRAGCAMLVREHAIPSNTRHYGGTWVGGGVPIHAAVPYLAPGTFGWDYFGTMRYWGFARRRSVPTGHRPHLRDAEADGYRTER